MVCVFCSGRASLKNVANNLRASPKVIERVGGKTTTHVMDNEMVPVEVGNYSFLHDCRFHKKNGNQLLAFHPGLYLKH